MKVRLQRGLLPVLLLSGALLALGCGGGDDDPEAVCGNGVIEAGEQCDGANLNEQTCVTKGFDGGTLSCTADCKFDTSGCADAPADCGNGEIDEGEQCDGANLNEQTCETQGFDGGTLTCTAICQFDTTGCTKIGPDCGNGEIDAGEQCDGANLNEQTCETQGFDGGTLSCTATCQFDTTSCTKIEPDCGNGQIDAGEQCDGANLNEQTCETQGFDGGTLSCTSTCQFDTTSCTTIEKAGVGEPCTSNAECESNMCLTEVFDGYPSGYCVADCNPDFSCDDPNASCGIMEKLLCMRSCVIGGSDCREGYTCLPSYDFVEAPVCMPYCSEDSQCPDTGLCNDEGFCQTLCTTDPDCPASQYCGPEGVCNFIPDCDSYGCNDPSGEYYCYEEINYCFEDACAAGPCDGIAHATGCSRHLHNYLCNCDEGYLWDSAAGECISFSCNAIDLGTFDGTVISRTGDTCGGTSIYNALGDGVSSCTSFSSKSNEIVYSLTVPARQFVQVEMSSSGFESSLWATTSCDDILGLGCVWGADSSKILLLENYSLMAMTYYIVADGFSGCGEFTLTVSVYKPPRCGNGKIDGYDQCDGADLNEQTCQKLGYDSGTLSCTNGCTFDTSGCVFTCKAHDLGTYTGADITLEAENSCSGTKLYNAGGAGWNCTGGYSEGYEKVYSLTLEAGASVGVSMSPVRFNASLWVTTSCDDLVGAQCVAGVNEAMFGGREELVLANYGAEPQTYYIIADSPSGCGEFTLTVSEPSRCGNGKIDGYDQCDGADLGEQTCEKLGYDGGTLSCTEGCTFDASGCVFTCKAHDLGTYTGADITLEAENSCSGTKLYNAYWSCVYSGPDGYEKVYSLTLEAGASVGVSMSPVRFDALLWVTTSCDDFVGAQCVAGVDGAMFGGREELVFANDGVESQTYYIIADSHYSCGEFTLTVSEPPRCGNGKVDGPDMCDGTDLGEQTCEKLGYGGGTLGCTDDCRFDTSGCDFTCDAYDLGMFIDTITLEAENSCSGTKIYNAGSVGWNCTGHHSKGYENVYSLTLAAGQSVVISMSPVRFDASLWVTTSCDDILGAQCVAGVDRATFSGREELVLTNYWAEPQTYYIIADAFKNCGTFSLNIFHYEPPRCGNGKIDGNDQCDGADLGYQTCDEFGYEGGTLGCTEDCRFDTSDCLFTCKAHDLGTYTGADITLEAENSCNGTKIYNAGGAGWTCVHSGPDGYEKVYSLTLEAGASVTISMSPIRFDASLWVTTSCDDIFGSMCVAGVDTALFGDREELVLANDGAEPQTYYIIADSLYGCGIFDLTISRPSP
ncbi:MAG TPA: hypothetical protein PLV44_09170 [Myxococcota bacterium]|nr:hypothetical protein [Myxococcota bacterium]